jgi:hypothetical protein
MNKKYQMDSFGGYPYEFDDELPDILREKCLLN